MTTSNARGNDRCIHNIWVNAENARVAGRVVQRSDVPSESVSGGVARTLRPEMPPRRTRSRERLPAIGRAVRLRRPEMPPESDSGGVARPRRPEVPPRVSSRDRTCRSSPLPEVSPVRAVRRCRPRAISRPSGTVYRRLHPYAAVLSTVRRRPLGRPVGYYKRYARVGRERNVPERVLRVSRASFVRLSSLTHFLRAQHCHESVSKDRMALMWRARMWCVGRVIRPRLWTERPSRRAYRTLTP